MNRTNNTDTEVLQLVELSTPEKLNHTLRHLYHTDAEGFQALTAHEIIVQLPIQLMKMPQRFGMVQLNDSANSMEHLDYDTNEAEGMLEGEPPEMIAMLLHQLVTFLVTLFGNLLLIYVIIKNNRVQRRRRVTPVQMLMLHMCAADLLYALITILPTMAITLTSPNFYGPNALCKLVKFLQVIPMYASSFLLVAISADRYKAICRPLSSIKSNAYNRPTVYAAVAWTCALFFSTPQLAVFAKSGNDCNVTYTSAWQYALYVTIFNVAVWLLPSAIAGYLYFCVCRAVWQSSVFGTSFNKDAKEEALLDQEKFNKSNSMQIHRNGVRMQCVELDRRRVQTVKLTLTIVAANFLLWAPFCLISVIDALWPNVLSPVFATFIMFFGNLNSCVNPWLWFYFNRDHLRRAFFCYDKSDPTKLFKRGHATHQSQTTNRSRTLTVVSSQGESNYFE